MFIDRLKGIISWVLDGVTAIALLAAGIVCHALYSCDFEKRTSRLLEIEADFIH
jgi:hypothetical protein